MGICNSGSCYKSWGVLLYSIHCLISCEDVSHGLCFALKRWVERSAFVMDVNFSIWKTLNVMWTNFVPLEIDCTVGELVFVVGIMRIAGAGWLLSWWCGVPLSYMVNWDVCFWLSSLVLRLCCMWLATVGSSCCFTFLWNLVHLFGWIMSWKVIWI